MTTTTIQTTCDFSTRSLVSTSSSQQRLLVSSSSSSPFARRQHGRRGRNLTVSSTSSTSTTETETTGTEKQQQKLEELPKSTSQQVELAAKSVKKALESGKKNVEVTFDIPLIGATDLDDWPGGVRQQYQSMSPMVEALMKAVSGEKTVAKKVIDDADAVVKVTSGDDVCTTFPTAEVLSDLKQITKDAKRANMIINPQWVLNGNILNDFGFGPWREKNEKFVKEFEIAYFLKEQRIQGETFRLQKVFGGPWQVFVLNQQTGQVEPLPPFEERPSYRELEALLQSREGSIAAMNWVERAQSEMTFNAESLTRKPNNTNQDE
ncbi:predicted protein [Bathycoccus prasinos]|uniref:DUF1995 domain-containing protein n=1 Tax=Bathycoccus prasinos TaxID=41875 RepID=K8F3J3_9CHLO|nr:predicted protein [Bathycoccus prasinos]CCO66637.1 predicted protein [Bathycoccus prasinos]|eukprot:XP_007511077.1 predicted protein [Bathycoccus prasinos]